MTAPYPPTVDDWIEIPGPESGVVVSSRARLARNLPRAPFAPRAPKERLAFIARAIGAAIEERLAAAGYARLELSALAATERRFLKESHLISADLEKGREHREVWIGGDAASSIMVNEEDHLRIQTLASGLRVEEALRRVERIEAALEPRIEFAYGPQFGYLTACPTNTGTGLRLSVMLHLVALVMTNQIEEALSSLGGFGLVARGAHGEHSNHAGDLFQISNEVTLGKTEEELMRALGQVVRSVIDRELAAREFLFAHAPVKAEDAVQRALGVLTRARSVDSGEAATLLSRVRLAVGRDFGVGLAHEALSRMMIEVQPAHLQRLAPGAESGEDRDAARANWLRARFAEAGGRN